MASRPQMNQLYKQHPLRERESGRVCGWTKAIGVCRRTKEERGADNRVDRETDASRKFIFKLGCSQAKNELGLIV